MSPDDPAGPAQHPRPQYPRYPGEQQPDTVPPGAPRPPAATEGASSGSVAPSWPGPAATVEEPAGWWIRVLAAVLDWLVATAIVVVPFVGGLVVAFKDATYVEATDELNDVEPWGLVVTGAAMLLWLAVDLWNRGLRVGYRGQSLGKQAVGVHVVGGRGRPVGALEGFFRWLVATLLQWTLLGGLADVLWPLFDDQKQTLHDKAIGTYPVRRR